MQKQNGVTLIEYMLVMVIMLSILLLCIKQYQIYRQDADISQLQYNLDVIFQAMNKYYGQNCDPAPPPNQQPSGFCPSDNCPCNSPRSPFIICPLNANVTQVPIIIQLQELIDKNYLSINDLSIQEIMEQADSKGVLSVKLGYALQYNLKQNPIPTRVYTNPTTQVSKVIGLFVIWNMQLSIKLTKEASEIANTYQMRLNASCVSDYPERCATKPPPAPGTPSPPPAKYLIFERTTLSSTSSVQSSYWQMNASVKQFKKNYEEMPDWYMAETYPDALYYYYCNQ